MKIGFIGAGKLGLPVALAINAAGHEVVVTDVNVAVRGYVADRKIPYQEEGADELLKTHSIVWTDTAYGVIWSSDIVFMPVQTPHGPEYEGISPMPQVRMDFDYSFLVEAVRQAADICQTYHKKITLVIISTVLPGTIEREILPLLNEYITLVYNPFFIAMGTTIHDFRNPEFVLIGMQDHKKSYDANLDMVGIRQLATLYRSIHNRLLYFTGIAEAEMIKVSYNTYITMKIVFANNVMEICHKMGINCDDVTGALINADERLMSGKYLFGGMGDGGGCHPRDNIAMSWLARKVNLSHDFFTDIMEAREDQTEWLAQLIWDSLGEVGDGDRVVILGAAFKAGTNLTNGSPSLLLQYMLRDKFDLPVPIYDPFVPGYDDLHTLDNKRIFFVATNHDAFKEYIFPRGSVVIDPWRYLRGSWPGVTYIPVGVPLKKYL